MRKESCHALRYVIRGLSCSRYCKIIVMLKIYYKIGVLSCCSGYYIRLKSCPVVQDKHKLRLLLYYYHKYLSFFIYKY